MLDYLGILFALGVCALSFLWIKRAKLTTNVPNGLGTWTPLVGHFLFFIKKETHENWHDIIVGLHEQHKGKPFQLVPWVYPNIVYSISEDSCQHILKSNFKNYILPLNRIELFGELFGQGIFASNGKQWKLHRKSASHIFTTKQLQAYMTRVFLSHSTGELSALLSQTAGSAGGVVEMQSVFFQFTMGCFCEIAFGAQPHIPSGDSKSDFATAFDRLQHHMLQRIHTPLFKLNRFLGVGTEKEITEDLATLIKFVSRIIDRRKTEVIEREDLLYHYANFAARQGHTVTEQELRDTVCNFMIAGRDTTACLLSWLFYCLSLNPAAEDRLRLELSAAFGDNPVFDPARSYQQARSVPFLEACMTEILRLYPPVPADDRQALHDDVLPDGSQVLAGQHVAFNPYCYGRSSYIWGPSCLEFRPERHLDSSGQFVAPNAFKMPSFSAGPRMCLGRSTALLEVKLVVAVLLSRFVFRVPKKVEHRCTGKYDATIILKIKDGLPLHVQAVAGFSAGLNCQTTPAE
eukprot:gb/GEZN01004333.1/.p1 GENE.gb/GEZN01004333.1/~~gb/GEZN01004333.1/.p1  ORF type:complete len:518 (-),score=47.95 gb/GEZN01004333.1/:399-1952(-)